MHQTTLFCDIMSIMKKRTIKIVLRIIMLLGCGYGTASLIGVFSGEFNMKQLAFYTVQSNIVIFISYLVLILRPTRQDFAPTVMGALTLMIAITGLVYNFVLVPTLPDTILYGMDPLANFLVHTFTPLLVFVDWLLFADKRSLKYQDPLIWLGIPLAYFVFAIIRAQLGGPLMEDSQYPYFFIDIDQYGWLIVLRNVVGLLVIFVVISTLMIAVGKLFDSQFKKLNT